MGRVSDHVRKVIEERVRRAGLTVWYDRTGTFRELAETLCWPGLTVLAWQGSWLRLRHEADRWLLANARDLVGGQKTLLVYVPRERPREYDDLLLPLWKAGCRFGDGPGEDLAGLAREPLRGVLPETEIRTLLENPTVTLADLDAAAERRSGGGLVAVIFGDVGPHEVAARFLLDDGALQAVIDREALDDMRRYVRDQFGLDLPAADAFGLRQALARYVLLGELLYDLGEHSGRIRGALGKVPVPERPQDLEACRTVCHYMRDTGSLAEGYATLAWTTERDLNLASMASAGEAVAGGDTFPFQERTRLEVARRMIESGRLHEAQVLVEKARSSFWVRRTAVRNVAWNAVTYAITVLREASRVRQEVRCSKGKPVEDWIRNYAGSSRNRLAGGWYRLDRAYRLLEQQLRYVDDEDYISSIAEVARAAYTQAVIALAEGFCEALQMEDFDLSRLPQQHMVFERHVRPHLDRERTAYFLVDALRYEMGVDLAGRLGRDGEAACEPYLGILPGITEVGMAALMPGAEEGMELADRNGKLAVLVRGRVSGGPAERAELIRSRYPSAVDLTLDDLLELSTRKLGRRLEGANLVVVRSRELDEFGEGGNDRQAHKYMSDILDDLARASRALARVGFERQVFTADHGYLFLREADLANKVDPPGGHTVCLRRRSWAGRGGRTGADLVRVPSVKLGIAGELELAFPVGLGVFILGGGGYCHGGLTLQEMVIPVVSVVVKAKVPPSEQKGVPQLALAFPPGKITNRIFSVQVTYESLVPEPLTLTAELIVGGKRAGILVAANQGYDPASRQVKLQPNEPNALIFQVTDTELRSGQADIVVLDALSGTRLASLPSVPVDLVH